MSGRFLDSEDLINVESLLSEDRQTRVGMDYDRMFRTACEDLGLDSRRIQFDFDFDFKSSRSSFDHHTMQTLGDARAVGDYLEARHTIRLDRSLKENTVRWLHTLYHELSHCVVYEEKKRLQNRDLDIAWEEAFVELVSFLAVLSRLRYSDWGFEQWLHYNEFKTKNINSVIEGYKRNRVRNEGEEYELRYKELRWVLYEAYIQRPRRFKNLQKLLEELIYTNGNDLFPSLPNSEIQAVFKGACGAGGTRIPAASRLDQMGEEADSYDTGSRKRRREESTEATTRYRNGESGEDKDSKRPRGNASNPASSGAALAVAAAAVAGFSFAGLAAGVVSASLIGGMLAYWSSSGEAGAVGAAASSKARSQEAERMAVAAEERQRKAAARGTPSTASARRGR